MLRLLNSQEYLARHRPRYQKLYAGDANLYFWPTKQASLFRAQHWRIAPLAGDPWRAMPVASGERIDWTEHSHLDPHASAEDAYRQHVYRQYWEPWAALLKERQLSLLILSTYELIEDEPCCAECGLDWKEIGDALRAIEYHIADGCALFGMSDDWAMYCWEGLAILGGTPEFIARYGELAGGWERLRNDFKKHLDGDYNFRNQPNYRAAVEGALSGPDVAWSHARQGERRA